MFLINLLLWVRSTQKQVKPETVDSDSLSSSRLGEEVGGLFLHASPCVGIRAGLAGARDSGYDSLHRRLSVLDRLVQTHPVWLQLGLSQQEAELKLREQPPGVRME